jgi:hypothetical protein
LEGTQHAALALSFRPRERVFAGALGADEGGFKNRRGRREVGKCSASGANSRAKNAAEQRGHRSCLSSPCLSLEGISRSLLAPLLEGERESENAHAYLGEEALAVVVLVRHGEERKRNTKTKENETESVYRESRRRGAPLSFSLALFFFFFRQREREREREEQNL